MSQTPSGNPPPPPPPPAGYGGSAPATPARRPVTRAPSAGLLRLRQLVWLAVTVVDIILALRVVFVAFHTENRGFVHIVYRIANVLAAPFAGLFRTTTQSGHPIEWGMIIAIVVYTLAAWIVARLLRIIGAPSRTATAY